MPRSMRKQAADEETRREKEEIKAQNRIAVLNALRADINCNQTALEATTQVSRRVISRMATALKENNEYELTKLLNVTENRRGRSRVLTDAEEKMLCERIIFAASRGFGVYEDELPELMAKISNDGREAYKRRLPSSAAVRNFRARHREITLRKGQEKEKAKLLAENPDHARTCEKVLRLVIDKHPHLKMNPEYIWNMDETQIDGKGKTRKMYCSSSSSSTGFDTTNNGGGGPHVTCVVATSPCGKKIPPFYIVAGKMFMKKWLDPLSKPQNYESCPEELKKFFKEKWIDPEAGIALTEKGSMTKEVLVAWMRHFEKHARKITPDPNKAILLLIDGHKSRCGMDWIDVARHHNIEVIQTPANTSHYLQAGDRDVNLRLKKTGRETTTILSKYTNISPVSVQFKLMKCTYGHDAIAKHDIQVSWTKTGLWPMNFQFVQIAENMWSGRQADAIQNEPLIDLTRAERDTDDTILRRLKEIVSNETTSPARRIQQSAILINNSTTTNSILMDVGPATSSSSRNSSPVIEKTGSRSVKAGAPAVLLTGEDYLRMIEDQDEKKRSENEAKLQRIAARKEKKRLKDVELSKKRLQREKNREEKRSKRTKGGENSKAT